MNRAVALLAVGLALAGPLLAGAAGLDALPTVARPWSPPGPGLPLGTDALGRDVAARVLAGGAALAAVALLGGLAATVPGTAAGLWAGWSDGRAARAATGLADVLLAVPLLLLALVTAVALPAPVVATAAGGAPLTLRVVADVTRRTRGAGFVQAALARGESTPAVLAREVLPAHAGVVAADLGVRTLLALQLAAAFAVLASGRPHRPRTGRGCCGRTCSTGCAPPGSPSWPPPTIRQSCGTPTACCPSPNSEPAPMRPDPVLIDPADLTPPSGALVSEHRAQWGEVYDWTYASPGPDPALDTAGWRAAGSGQELPAEHMAQWADRTVELVLATGPRRVLELGCGTGMLLHRLHPRLDSYVGTDIAADIAARHTALGLPHVRVVRAAAHEITGPAVAGALDDAAPDCVLLNSVTQCFPDLAYLTAVLRDAVAVVAAGGTIVVGDARHAELHRRHCAELDPDDPDGRAAADPELLLDPATIATAALAAGRDVRIAVHARPSRQRPSWPATGSTPCCTSTHPRRPMPRSGTGRMSGRTGSPGSPHPCA